MPRKKPVHNPPLHPGTSPIQRLPEDCLRCILFYLSDIDLTLCARVCKAWKTASRSDSLWKPFLMSMDSSYTSRQCNLLSMPLWKLYRKLFLLIHSEVRERAIDPSTGRVKTFFFEDYPCPVGDTLPCIHYLRLQKNTAITESDITKRVKENHWRALSGASQGTKERSIKVEFAKRKSLTCRLNKNTKVPRNT